MSRRHGAAHGSGRALDAPYPWRWRRRATPCMGTSCLGDMFLDTDVTEYRSGHGCANTVTTAVTGLGLYIASVNTVKTNRMVPDVKPGRPLLGLSQLMPVSSGIWTPPGHLPEHY